MRKITNYSEKYSDLNVRLIETFNFVKLWIY